MNEMHLHRKTDNDYGSVEAWNGDVLGRKKIADKLTNLVAGLRGSFVLSLEGTYGEGKTFFLRHWQKDLQEKGYITAYFNSWENDYSDDPFLPFMACLEQAISDHKKQKLRGKTVSAWKKNGDFAKKAISGGTKIIAKGLIRYALGDGGMDEIKDLVDSDTEKDLTKAIGDAVGNAMNKQLEQQKSIQLFRQSLGKSVTELTSKFDDDNQKKIIILVDELDRCKPTYAVKVLERIKHFFDVDGLVFVLGINRQQVANSMSAVYGAKLDTEGYLRRFIHWEFQLPIPSAPDYTKLLVQKFGLDKLPILQETSAQNSQDWHHNNFDVLAEHFGVVSEALSLTLRQQEQAFTAANLLLRTLGPEEKPFGAILGTLVPLWFVQSKDCDNERGLTWESLINNSFKNNHPKTNSLGLNYIDNLFKALYVKIEKIGGMKRFQHWQDKPSFEGSFRAWFVPPTFKNQISGLRRFEPGQVRTPEIQSADQCNNEMSNLFNDVFNSPQRHNVNEMHSAAQQIWNRLEDNKQLLIAETVV